MPLTEKAVIKLNEPQPDVWIGLLLSEGQEDAGPVESLRLNRNFSVNVQKSCDALYNKFGVWHSSYFDECAWLFEILTKERFASIKIKTLRTGHPSKTCNGKLEVR